MYDSLVMGYWMVVENRRTLRQVKIVGEGLCSPYNNSYRKYTSSVAVGDERTSNELTLIHYL